MVVIAIIVLLAAILFPAFGRARENARKSTCQSNLKQIALGFAQYVQDSDGTYPSQFYFTSEGWIGWAQVMQPYLKSIQIYQCPSEPNPSNPYIKDLSTGNGSYHWQDYTDYALNANFFESYEPYGTYAGQTKPRRDSQLSGQALTVLLGDSWNTEQDGISAAPVTDGYYKFVYNSNGEETSQTYTATPMAMQRHLDGANYAFADGHVKWLKHTSISRGSAGYYPQSDGWSQPYPGVMKNAMPPCKLAAPYSATFSPVDYFCD